MYVYLKAYNFEETVVVKTHTFIFPLYIIYINYITLINTLKIHACVAQQLCTNFFVIRTINNPCLARSNSKDSFMHNTRLLYREASRKQNAAERHDDSPRQFRPKKALYILFATTEQTEVYTSAALFFRAERP